MRPVIKKSKELCVAQILFFENPECLRGRKNKLVGFYGISTLVVI